MGAQPASAWGTADETLHSVPGTPGTPGSPGKEGHITSSELPVRAHDVLYSPLRNKGQGHPWKTGGLLGQGGPARMSESLAGRALTGPVTSSESLQAECQPRSPSRSSALTTGLRGAQTRPPTPGSQGHLSSPPMAGGRAPPPFFALIPFKSFMRSQPMEVRASPYKDRGCFPEKDHRVGGFLLRAGQGCGVGPAPRSSRQPCGGPGPARSCPQGEGSSGLHGAAAAGGGSLARRARTALTAVFTTGTAPEASWRARVCVEDARPCREDCGFFQSLLSHTGLAGHSTAKYRLGRRPPRNTRGSKTQPGVVPSFQERTLPQRAPLHPSIPCSNAPLQM